MESKEITCKVCMHHCHLKEGKVGRCKARRNENGKSREIFKSRICRKCIDFAVLDVNYDKYE